MLPPPAATQRRGTLHHRHPALPACCCRQPPHTASCAGRLCFAAHLLAVVIRLLIAPDVRRHKVALWSNGQLRQSLITTQPCAAAYTRWTAAEIC